MIAKVKEGFTCPTLAASFMLTSFGKSLVYLGYPNPVGDFVFFNAADSKLIDYSSWKTVLLSTSSTVVLL